MCSYAFVIKPNDKFCYVTGIYFHLFAAYLAYLVTSCPLLCQRNILSVGMISNSFITLNLLWNVINLLHHRLVLFGLWMLIKNLISLFILIIHYLHVIKQNNVDDISDKPKVQWRRINCIPITTYTLIKIISTVTLAYKLKNSLCLYYKWYLKYL